MVSISHCNVLLPPHSRRDFPAINHRDSRHGAGTSFVNTLISSSTYSLPLRLVKQGSSYISTLKPRFALFISSMLHLAPDEKDEE